MWYGLLNVGFLLALGGHGAEQALPVGRVMKSSLVTRYPLSLQGTFAPRSAVLPLQIQHHHYLEAEMNPPHSARDPPCWFPGALPAPSSCTLSRKGSRKGSRKYSKHAPTLLLHHLQVLWAVCGFNLPSLPSASFLQEYLTIPGPRGRLLLSRMIIS